MAKNIFIEHSVDSDTGEVTAKRWVTKGKFIQEKFVKYYIESNEFTQYLTSGQFRVLFELGRVAEYNTNKITLDKEKKNAIADACQMKSIATIITFLVKSNLLVKVSHSVYIVNVRILFNGEESERNKILTDNIALFNINKLFLQNK